MCLFFKTHTDLPLIEKYELTYICLLLFTDQLVKKDEGRHIFKIDLYESIQLSLSVTQIYR